MFGTLRFVLALLVAVGHLAGRPFWGIAAVLTFFTLSGYLMTKITQERYRGALHR